MASAAAQPEPPALISAFFDAVSGTVSYLLADPGSGQAAVIDPVLEFDPACGALASTGCDRIIAQVRRQRLQLQWILETHAHADHLSGAQYLRQQLGGKVAVGARIRQVQALFRGVLPFDSTFEADGSQFDHLFADGEVFHVGQLPVTALPVPGHTPADMAYAVGNDIFVGDTLFMPDVGTARADFPGGDAATLYASIQRLLALPAATRIHVCHDYPPAGRGPAWRTTVAAQRADNIHVRAGVDQAAFVAMRQRRDAALPAPRLLLPALQVNLRAGCLPTALPPEPPAGPV